MVVVDKEQRTKFKNYYKSLNQKQLDWIKHKCNWEQISVISVCRIYREHIDGIGDRK